MLECIMRAKVALLLLGFLIVFDAQAQVTKDDSRKKDNLYLSSRTSVGYILPTNDFLTGANYGNRDITWGYSESFALGVQTTGNKEWHHVLKFPYYGGAVYTAGFPQTNEMGQPIAVYGFMGFPVKRTDNYSFGYELGFGVASNWKQYDVHNNPNNITIGSGSTVYIGASLYWAWELNSKWQVKTGVGFTHFSNGAIKKPNKGLNLAAPFFELNYRLDELVQLERQVVPNYKKHQEIATHFSYSRKQEEYKSTFANVPSTMATFNAYNLSVAYMRQINWKNKFGGGVDISYDTQGNLSVSQNDKGEVIVLQNNIFSDRIAIGLFGTYEFCINKLSVASSLGAYVKPHGNSASIIYQRIGLKYHFENNIYLGVLVRAYNLSVADMLEFCVGYRIKWD